MHDIKNGAGNSCVAFVFLGGTGFDKDHLVANEFTADRGTQYWDIEIV